MTAYLSAAHHDCVVKKIFNSRCFKMAILAFFRSVNVLCFLQKYTSKNIFCDIYSS